MKMSATAANPSPRVLNILAILLLAMCGIALGQSSSKQATDPAVAKLGPEFASADAQVNGITLHYVRGGTGPAVILLHAFPEDWYEYHKVMPRLARKFTVVAVDLPGIGGSMGKPGGYAATDVADDIHQLQEQLHLEHAYVVGHDIGGMLAYAFVRRYPEAVRGAMILDVPLPGLAPWKEITANPFIWHIHFQQVPGLAEELVRAARRFTSATSSMLDTLATPTWRTTPNLMQPQNTCMRPSRFTAPFPPTKSSMLNSRVGSKCRWYWR